MTKRFDSKCQALHGLISATCKYFLFVTEDEDDVCVQAQAPFPVLLHMANRLCKSIRGSLMKTLDNKEELVDDLMQTILLSDKQIDEEYDKLMNDKRIPDWLREIMGLVKDESTDKADDEEDEDEEETDGDGDNPDLSVRVDLHVHNDDDGDE